jgi:D-glycero-D-manno-heptose 1,7-bisphosphate phosphatase
MNKAIFIDKDGTMVEDVPYNINPDKIKLYPDVPLALRRLQDQGYKIVVVSNQSGIAYGYFDEAALDKVWTRISSLLENSDVKIDAYYYCPHHSNGKVQGLNIECECRKPQPGMLLKAASDLNIDLSQSWMIGDILNDVEAGNRAGCKTILINNGNETEWVLGEFRVPDYFAASVLEAAIMIDNHKDLKKRIFKSQLRDLLPKEEESSEELVA